MQKGLFSLNLYYLSFQSIYHLFLIPKNYTFFCHCKDRGKIQSLLFVFVRLVFRRLTNQYFQPLT